MPGFNVAHRCYIGPMVSSHGCSAGMLRLIGWDPKGPQPTPEQWQALLHPVETRLRSVSAEAFRAQAAELLNAYRIVTPQGETRWLSGTVEFVEKEDGRGTVIQGIAADLTERKSLEQEHQGLLQLIHDNQRDTRILREQKRWLDTTLEAAKLGLWELNLRG